MKMPTDAFAPRRGQISSHHLAIFSPLEMSCARRSSSVAAASWKPLRRSTSRRSPCSVLLSQGNFASSEDAIRGESAAVDREGGSKPRTPEAPSWGSLGAGRAQIALPQGKEGKPKLWGQLKINAYVPSSGRFAGSILVLRR